ncbi:MAG TPA: hypothetical protein PK417_07930 [Hyphomonas sp.]|nr:hypothetical protein [Hyphomonas sp.]
MSLADVLGLIITLTSVVIAVLAVFIGYLLSQNYSKYIKELETMRVEAQKSAEQIQAINDFNGSLLKESMLAVRTIFDLLMLMDRKANYDEVLKEISDKQIWKGRKVTKLQQTDYIRRVSQELKQVDLAICARRTELYWLVGQRTEKAAHLHALTSTSGDHRTLDLLESIKEARHHLSEKEELLIASAALRQRLGLPIKMKRVEHDSRGWTGRY